MPSAVPDVRAAFQNAIKPTGLRSNASRDTIAYGRDIRPLDMPDFGIRVEQRPIVLKHAGPVGLPILIASNLLVLY